MRRWTVIPDWKKFISSGENIIRFLGDYIAKHIRQNSSLQEGQLLYLAGLFSNPETVKMRLWSTVPFCLFDRVLNVISIKDIDENGCKLKTRDLIFFQNQVPSHQSYIAKHIRQNSSLQEGQLLYLAGLFSNPETVKMLNQNGMLDCSCLASIILHALYYVILLIQFVRIQCMQNYACQTTAI
jgi:hypothetical protein